MKKTTRLVLIAFGLLFGLLFLGRFVYEITVTQAPPAASQVQLGGFEANMAQQEMNQSVDSSVKRGVTNIASSKIVIKQAAAADQVIDQKYERVAQLAAHSSEFDADRAKLAAIQKSLEAVVQQENSTGLKGARRLQLSLGVVPDSFDRLVQELNAIGTIDSIAVNKTDKTADFKALAAKRLSLEKSREGLRALKVPGAALADLIQLETRILEIEGQIQELGVSLGDFEESNSLCTVQFSLRETKPVPGPNILAALLDALAWTLPIFLGLVFAAALALAAAVLTGILVDRIRQWAQQAQAAKPMPAGAPEPTAAGAASGPVQASAPKPKKATPTKQAPGETQ